MKIKLKAKYVSQHPKFFPGCEQSHYLFRAFNASELTPLVLHDLYKSGITVEYVGDIHMIDEKGLEGKRSKNTVLIEGKRGEELPECLKTVEDTDNDAPKSKEKRDIKKK